MARQRLSKMRITRVSLVDRPAGIGAEVVLSKRDDSAGDGDGIMKNTNPFIGHGKMTQAGVVDDEQGASMGVKKNDTAVEDDTTTDDVEKSDRPRRKRMAKSEVTLEEILKGLPEEAVAYIERLEDIVLDLSDTLAKAEDDGDDEEDDDDEDDVAKDDEEGEPVGKSDGDLESLLKAADPRLARLVKGYVSKAEKKADAAANLAKRERDLRLHREYVAKAADLSALPGKREDIVTILKTVADKAPEVEVMLTDLLKAAHGALKEGLIFKTEGSDATDNNTAIAKFDAMVAELRKSDSTLTAEQAFAKALNDHPELYDEYLNTNTSKGR